MQEGQGTSGSRLGVWNVEKPTVARDLELLPPSEPPGNTTLRETENKHPDNNPSTPTAYKSSHYNTPPSQSNTSPKPSTTHYNNTATIASHPISHHQEEPEHTPTPQHGRVKLYHRSS